MAFSFFTRVAGTALLREKGLFTSHEIYTNSNNELFVRKREAFIRLLDHGGTSKTGVFWDDIHFESERYAAMPHEGRVRLAYLDKKTARQVA